MKNKFNEIVNYNCILVKKFYKSSFYSEIIKECKKTESTFFKTFHHICLNVINGIYADPDSEIILPDKYKKECFKNIKFSGDGILNWKFIYKINEGKPDWIDDYKEIRTSPRGTNIWPCSMKQSDGKTNIQTINQWKNSICYERIDFLLYYIKHYYIKSNSYSEQLKALCSNEYTKLFLDSFTDSDEKTAFAQFVEFCEFEELCEKIDNIKPYDYEVSNLNTKDLIILTDDHINKFKEQIKSVNRYGLTRFVEYWENYYLHVKNYVIKK